MNIIIKVLLLFISSFVIHWLTFVILLETKQYSSIKGVGSLMDDRQHKQKTEVTIICFIFGLFPVSLLLFINKWFIFLFAFYVWYYRDELECFLK